MDVRLEMLRAYERVFRDAGLPVYFSEGTESLPYPGVGFEVVGLGGSHASATVYIQFLPTGPEVEAVGTHLVQILARHDTPVAEGARDALFAVVNAVNGRIPLGAFMIGPDASLLWRHTFYLTSRVDPLHNVRLMDQMAGLVLHTLHATWEPLVRTASGQIDAATGSSMVLAHHR